MRHDLYTFTTLAAARLKTQAAGIVVQYDGERIVAQPGAPLCVLGLDYDGGDVFGPPPNAGNIMTGPVAGDVVKRSRASTATGCKATVSAVSGKAGATKQDHEGVVLDARDKLICALAVIGTANRMPIDWGTASGRFLAADPDAQNAIGARYEFRFRIGAAIEEIVGELAPEMTPIVTVLADRGDVDPEQNCGPAAEDP